MNALKLGLAAALVSGVALAQTTTGTTNTTPTLAAPGTTMGTTPGIPGRPLPGVTTNTPAQLSPSNNSSATPPAVTTSNANNKTGAAPVKGRNSFTMNEARRRIEKGGFTQVTGLKKDADGIWRGKGMKNGASMDVYCDYQGNVGAAS
jgi:hypothetical protein